MKLTANTLAVFLVLYFVLLFFISWLSTYKSKKSLQTFFVANKKAPWFLVAYGMIGTTLSGVTFISVPGSVAAKSMSYFQMVLGYFLGYLAIANILLPLYYRLNLTSIYSYLEQRFGEKSYKTGAFYFLLSRTLGSAARLYLVAIVLQKLIFDELGVPFAVTVVVSIALIYLYTSKGGLKTIIWTDTLQTSFMLAAVIGALWVIFDRVGGDTIKLYAESDFSQIFFWDWKTPQNFFKQVISGALIAIVMTGLDQDMMQKNLTCKNLGDAKKNMTTYSLAIIVVNFLFLALGVLLYIYAEQIHLKLPENSDYVFPEIAVNNMPFAVGLIFFLGLIAAAYSSADGSLAALTTSFTIDFLKLKDFESKKSMQIKNRTHIAFSVIFILVILIFKWFEENKAKDWDFSVIHLVLMMASYTYAPLLGLYTFGLFTKRKVLDKFVPLIAIVSPILTLLLNNYSEELFSGYKFGYELLLINGGMTFLGLWMISRKDLKQMF